MDYVYLILTLCLYIKIFSYNIINKLPTLDNISLLIINDSCINTVNSLNPKIIYNTEPLFAVQLSFKIWYLIPYFIQYMVFYTLFHSMYGL
jgi:hypothetical protein